MLTTSLLVFVGCAGPAAVQQRVEFDPDCIYSSTVESAGSSSKTVSVGFLDGTSHLETSSGIARLVTADANRNLFHVDCNGTLVPDLANTWFWVDGGWQFTLRASMTPDPARVVIDNWPIPEDDISSWRPSYVSPTLIRIEMESPDLYPPLILATMKYGISDSLFGDSEAGQSIPADIRRVPLGNSDSRDRIVDDVSALFTREISVVEFAKAEPSLIAIPLPNDKVYVFVASTVRPAATALHLPVASLATFENATAQIVNSAQNQYWWRTTSCVFAPESKYFNTNTLKNIVLYLEGDELGKDLASRMVTLPALSDTSTTSFLEYVPGFQSKRDSLRVLPADIVSLRSALKSQEVFGAVISLPTRQMSSCSEALDLAKDLPWTDNKFNAIIPLIESQEFLILRADNINAAVDYFGQVRLSIPNIEATE